MVDHIRTLLLNPEGIPGYRRVLDGPADEALSLFGVNGADDYATVDILMPLVMSADLASFRDVFDPRISPRKPGSVYRSDYDVAPSLDELHSRVLSPSGWWKISSLFVYDDPQVNQRLAALRDAAASGDSAFALGAVLLACAYRRLLLQEEM